MPHTRKQRKREEEQNAATELAGEANSEFNMDPIAVLLEEHQKALSADFKAAITKLETKLDLIQAAVTDHGSRITELETNANLHDGRILALEATCAKLSENNAKLTEKIADLKSHSQRNNIRIIGIPESIEGPHPSTFFSELLAEVFGPNMLESALECDRAHRTLSTKPGPGQSPRPVIIRLHRFQQKERIIREAWSRRGELKYRGTPIAIYEDYAPEIMEQRHQCRGVMAELYNLGLKPASYPARLTIVTKDGGKKRLFSVGEAKDYLASMHDKND